jgi:peptidoglycan/LPS O-acetylase OafA/YrhL
MSSLDAAFDARRNALNSIRLALASAVIFRHAQVITGGSTDAARWNDQLLGQLPVDGFFAVSGYLIAGSWIRSPNVKVFLLARAARVYPAFWVCLAITAFIFAPVAMMAEGRGWSEPFLGGDGSFAYLLKNFSLIMVQNDIAGTPSSVPWPGDWNGSLWTLKWEFLCYMGILVLGVTGLLTRRWFAILGFGAAWSIALIVCLGGPDKGSIADLTRFVLMYAAGVLLHRYADRVPARWALVALSVGVVSLSGLFVEEYRLVAAIPLAYALVTAGVLIQIKPLRLPNDISYGVYIYGFAVEQLLAYTEAVGLWSFWFACVATVLTVPMAMASWFLVEKPVQTAVKRHRDRGRAKVSSGTSTATRGGNR